MICQSTQFVGRTDPKSHQAVYIYDETGRRTETRHYHANDLDNPARVVTFTYDARGRLTGYDDGVMSGSYSYDDLGRKTSETVNYPGFSRTHEKTWHANGRQASLTAPHGTTYSFSWDNADRLQAVAIPGEGVIAYSQYLWHQPTEIQFPGGTVRTNSFDGLQRHTGIQVVNDAGQTLMDYQYTWDETGNITEKATEHGLYQYGYDDIDRLTQAEYPTFSAEEWTYDPLGNRLTDAGTGESEWQYNDNNELLNSVDYTYEYDANGSLIAEFLPDGTLYRSHEYNAETRLSAVRDGQGELIAEYSYDPFGRRTSKTVYDPPGQNPEITWYLYSDQGLMAELDGLGNQLEFYLFPPDGLWSTDPILRRSEAVYFYYQTDHLGTPQQLVDGAGGVVHSREMRAFGEVLESGIEDRLRFPGQLYSGETGLYYNYFRDYEPTTGRYVQSDPIGLWGGHNLYSYAFLNPTIFSDPYGLNPWLGRFVVCAALDTAREVGDWWKRNRRAKCRAIMDHQREKNEEACRKSYQTCRDGAVYARSVRDRLDPDHCVSDCMKRVDARCDREDKRIQERYRECLQNIGPDFPPISCHLP